MDSIIVKDARRKYVVSGDYARLKDFVCRVPQLFARGEGEVLHTGRNELRRFEVDGLRVVAKRYKRVNAVQRVAYSFFRKTKARRAYEFAAVFRQRGIDTPREVAYIEERERGLFTTGYFVSLDCPFPPAFPVVVKQEDYRKDLADALAAFICKMHERGILHGDMNLKNFLYDERADGSVRFSVVDTNRSHFCQGWPTRRQCLANLRTLTYRREVFVRIVRRYAALRGWDEGEAVGEALRCLERFIERRARRYKVKEKLKK